MAQVVEQSRVAHHQVSDLSEDQLEMVSPPEQAIFREFQSYVRAISAEVTEQTASELRGAVRQLAGEVNTVRGELRVDTETLIKRQATAVQGVEQSAADAARQLTAAMASVGAAFVDAVEHARRSLADEALAAEMRRRQIRQERLIYALIVANALWFFFFRVAGL